MANKVRKCGACGTKEGELHEFGCDMERCPFCGNQLVSCQCVYKFLDFEFDFDRPNCGLPKEIYEDGLTDEMWQKWFNILDAKGRYPFIDYPLMCARCGKKWPEFFRVENHEWNSIIEHDYRKSIICPSCYEFIKSATIKARE